MVNNAIKIAETEEPTLGIEQEDLDFCQAYVMHNGNGSEAVRETGSTVKNPGVVAWKKLKNPLIRKEIERIRGLLKKAYWIETDKIISKLHKMLDKYTDSEYEKPADELRARDVALKAADQLAKYYGLYQEKTEHTETRIIRIELPDGYKPTGLLGMLENNNVKVIDGNAGQPAKIQAE